MTIGSALLALLAGVLVVVGVVGLVVPILPGPALVFSGLVLAAWAEDFQHVGVWELMLLGALTALAFVVDFAATALGARKLGATRAAMFGATVGAAIGMFFGLPGIIVCPFLGAVVGELLAHRGVADAGRAGVGAWIGLLFGGVLKIAIVLIMLATFVFARAF